jgi:hypothetical protein
VLSIVKLADVNGEPRFKTDLPGPLRNGDPVVLRCVLSRQTGGRSEILEVDGMFRVDTVGFDTSTVPHRQLLSLVPSTRVPTWRSVKKRSSEARRLGPSVFPRTKI